MNTIKRIEKIFALAWLWIRARVGPAVTDPSTTCVVALTSYGSRIKTCGMTIESIGRGSAKPSRLILYLAESERHRPLPGTLKHQARRGLEIRWCDDLRSYKKSYPYATESPAPTLPLVTADDDILYPKWWLERLSVAGEATPNAIHGYRGRKVLINSQADLAPYREWPMSATTTASFATILTGVSGIYYPTRFLSLVSAAGTEFLDLAPTADDIWMHSLAVKHGFPHRQVLDAPQEFQTIPLTQSSALMLENVERDKNDDQIRSCYSPTEILKISEAAAILDTP